MQTPERARMDRRQRWRSGLRVLVLGMVLGMLQFLLLLGAAKLQPAVVNLNEGLFGALLPWWPFVAVAVFLSLLFPAVASFLAALQSGGTSSWTGIGILVGCIGFSVMVLASWVTLQLAPPPSSPPACLPNCGGVGQIAGAEIGASYAAAATIFGLFWNAMAGAVGGGLGGWMGDTLRERRANRSPWSSDAGAEQRKPIM